MHNIISDKARASHGNGKEDAARAVAKSYLCQGVAPELKRIADGYPGLDQYLAE